MIKRDPVIGCDCIAEFMLFIGVSLQREQHVDDFKVFYPRVSELFGQFPDHCFKLGIPSFLRFFGKELSDLLSHIESTIEGLASLSCQIKNLAELLRVIFHAYLRFLESLILRMMCFRIGDKVLC